VLKGRHERKEIRVLAADKKLATLFLRSLSLYMMRDHTKSNSFFQAAAVHGLPYEAFDGVDPIEGGWQPGTVTGEDGTQVSKFGGYCHHSTQLFPPWHRPYLMMAEQVGHSVGGSSP
jgi:tyrosinase